MNCKRHYAVCILIATCHLSWCQPDTKFQSKTSQSSNSTPKRELGQTKAKVTGASEAQASKGADEMSATSEPKIQLPQKPARDSAQQPPLGLFLGVLATSLASLLVVIVLLVKSSKWFRKVASDLKKIRTSADTYSGMERPASHDDFRQLKDGQEQIIQLWKNQSAPKQSSAEDLRRIEALQAEVARLNDELAQATRTASEQRDHRTAAESSSRALNALITIDSRFKDATGALLGLDVLLARLAALDSEGCTQIERSIGFEARQLTRTLEGVRSTGSISAGPALNLSRRRPYWIPTAPGTAGLYALLDYCRGRAIEEVQNRLRTEVVAPVRGTPFDPNLHDEDGRSVPPSADLEGKVCECMSIGFRGYVQAKVLRFGKFEAQPPHSESQSSDLYQRQSEISNRFENAQDEQMMDLTSQGGQQISGASSISAQSVAGPERPESMTVSAPHDLPGNLPPPAERQLADRAEREIDEDVDNHDRLSLDDLKAP